ncbi:MAG: ATP-binding protein [Nanoarchaeota archaeon]|nr:ATP-binding protein [Nanoarchaeota archaeon]
MVETRKIVLIGGPSSGKSTLIGELGKRGYNVMNEVAREVIGERAHIEATPDEITTRQGLIYVRQVEAEKCAGLIFLDRGVLDIVAYSNHLLGYTPFEVVDPKYDRICSLERLPFVDDGLRVESGDEEAQMIHEKILDVYREYNYSLLSIPVIKSGSLEESVSKRADYLLGELEGFI